MEAVPNQTIYISNLNEKIKKNALKKILYMLFSQYGKVLQIVACKGIKMRGQAWVVFNEVMAASNALKGKQGFQFFGKPMKIQFAKAKSNVVEKKEVGPIKTATKRSREEDSDDEINPPKESRQFTTSDVPSRILFVNNLPSSIGEEVLQSTFQNCPGFKEVRPVPGNKTIAFVEFENEIQSGMALKQLNGIPLIGDSVLSISYSN